MRKLHICNSKLYLSISITLIHVSDSEEKFGHKFCKPKPTDHCPGPKYSVTRYVNIRICLFPNLVEDH